MTMADWIFLVAWLLGGAAFIVFGIRTIRRAKRESPMDWHDRERKMHGDE